MESSFDDQRIKTELKILPDMTFWQPPRLRLRLRVKVGLVIGCENHGVNEGEENYTSYVAKGAIKICYTFSVASFPF